MLFIYNNHKHTLAIVKFYISLSQWEDLLYTLHGLILCHNGTDSEACLPMGILHLSTA